MQPKKASGQYQFADNKNYQDYSSGRVLYGVGGSSNFPVRLASEIFQRSIYYLRSQGVVGPYALYDPFCGAAYSLTVLGFLHGKDIGLIVASDVDENIIVVAQKNLCLLTATGLNERREELCKLECSYHKDSHKQALLSINRLASLLSPTSIETQIFPFDILSNQNLPINLSSLDLIITELPYGKLNHWQGAKKETNSPEIFLNNIRDIIKPKALVSITFDKKQAVSYNGFKKLQSFTLGLRKVLFLQAL